MLGVDIRINWTSKWYHTQGILLMIHGADMLAATVDDCMSGR